MFVVLSGRVTISQRDGLGHVAPIARQGRGQFLGELAQLAGRVALVDAIADEDAEVLLITPDRLRELIVVEAELGERIVRALILRRVGLIEAGGSGPVLMGGPQLGAIFCACRTFSAATGTPTNLSIPAAMKRPPQCSHNTAVRRTTCWCSVPTERSC